MKRIKRLLVILAVLLAAALVAVNFFGGRMIRAGVHSAGPALMKVPVSLEDADFSLLRGKLELKGLTIGNPEGFKSDHLLKLGDLQVELKPGSLASDTIVIERVYLDAPSITFEKSLTGNNIAALTEALEGKGKEGGAAEVPAEDKAKKGGKKVVINDLIVENAKVSLAITALGGHGATMPVPTIHLKDIGKEKGGASWAEVIKDVFGAIAGSATSVAAGAGELAGEGAKAVGEGAAAVAGVAADGAKAAGEVVGEAGKAIGDGAAKVLEGVGGLFGGKKKEE